MNPVEGSLILYESNGYVYTGISRGYMHPFDKVIVEPYREISCRKAPSFSVEKEFLYCIQRFAPVVPVDRIIASITPWRILSHVRERLPGQIVEMIESIPSLRIGVTGSYALGCETHNSDVDIVIFSRQPEAVLRWLEAKREKGVIKQCNVNRVLRKRRGSTDISVNRSHIERSLVESCYKGIPYTLRLLRAESVSYCIETVPKLYYLGRARIYASIGKRSIDSIMVPARYLLKLEGAVTNSDPRDSDIILESFRTRYADLAPGRYLVEGELFLDVEDDLIIISPDLWGGVWRV